MGLGIEILCELIGIFGINRTPLLNLLRFIGNSSYRQEKIAKYKKCCEEKKENKNLSKQDKSRQALFDII